MIFKILHWLVILYFGMSTLYLFIISLAGLFKRRKQLIVDDRLRRFAILIPGFKEDSVIIETAMDALNQNYPRHLFDVVVIADSFLPETVEELINLPIRLVEVSFENSTKSKSINKALEILPEDYDVALILDADNLIENDFIKKINNSFSQGYVCVQGHRLAKNLDTSMAILDAISEEVNNSMFRKGHRVLGLSAALIGSGMAFDYKFYKNVMKSIDAVGGFDKELELILIKGGHAIEYCEDAIVYDEKVATIHHFSKQRRRWLSAQWIYLKHSFLSSFLELLTHGNFDYFIKAVQFSFPPRSLLIVFLFFATLISIFINPLVWTFIWAAMFLMVCFALLMATPRYFYNKNTLIALLSLPQGLLIMFLTLFRLSGANKKFIHTEHGISGNKKSKVANT